MVEGAARTLHDLWTAGLCLTAAGLVAGARDLTASYVKSRTQFGRSLAEFQATKYSFCSCLRTLKPAMFENSCVTS